MGATANTGVVELVLRSGPAAKIVLLLLLVFSVVSWGIILHKLWYLRRVERQTGTFRDVFRRSTKFSEVQAVCKTFEQSPLVGIFQAGYAELNMQLKQSSSQDPGSPGATPGRPTLKSLPAVDRALLRAAAVEVAKLERRLPLLATTASITPFIGLFGTVWGIMHAFVGLSNLQQVTLASVAPGIAEALFATAIGLVAAIPATIFYNMYTADAGKIGARLENFADEFSAIISRQLDERV